MLRPICVKTYEYLSTSKDTDKKFVLLFLTYPPAHEVIHSEDDISVT